MARVPGWMRGLAGLFLLLALLFFVTRVARTPRTPSPVSFPDNPVRVEIQRPDSRIVLEKKDDAWHVREPVDFPADKDAVNGLVESLRTLSVGDRLTQRPEKHAAFEVTESSGIRVQVTGAKTGPVGLIVGKMASDYTHVYVRRPETPDVYLASGLRRSDLEKPVTQWRDRRVASLGAAEVIGLEVRRKKDAFVLQKSSETWTINGKPADNQRVDPVISQLRTLSADEFVDPPASQDLKAWGLEPPSEALVIRLAQGDPQELRLGKKDPKSERVIVQRAGEDTLFWVFPYVFNELKSAQVFRQQSSPSAP
jgi:hypothetical protein